MCDECRKTPCDPRCPNYEPQTVITCAECGYELTDGDEAYLLDGEILCEYCKDEYIIASRRIVRKEDFE